MYPYYFWKLYPNPDPHKSGKLDPDPQKSQNSEALEAQNRDVKGHGGTKWRLEAQNGGLEAQNGGRRLKMEAWRLKMEAGGSKWSPGGSEDQWSQISITLRRSRIRIRMKVKNWIRILIKVKNWIRILIKVKKAGSVSVLK
jgi:hypothetical protein